MTTATKITFRASLKAACVGLALLAGAANGKAETLASLPTPSPAATALGSAKPIAAWTTFCNEVPAECAVDLTEPAVIKLTPQIWQAVTSINARVNASLTPMSDMDHWGVADRWNIPTDGAGDCEDFQLLKRKLLAETGLPRRAMRITVVIDPKGDGHAVLTLRTDRGDYILDNATSAVLPWHQTGYVFVKREGQDSLAWVSLGGATSPVATANR